MAAMSTASASRVTTRVPRRGRTRRVAIAAAVAIGVFATLAGGGCVGRLGRNDDYVRPDSEHPSANH
jgi:hypothetical protein